MKRILLFLYLFTLYNSTPSVDKPTMVKDLFKGVKTRIYRCISKSENASDKLKELVEKNMNTKGSLPLNIGSTDLTQDDRSIILQCRREAFKKKNTNSNFGITPIGIEYAQPRFKNIKLKEKTTQLRRLSVIDEVKRLGKFNFLGIFDCIENSQPALILIRNALNLIRSLDFTTAIISIYDNFVVINDALVYCLNAIVPL